MTTTANVTEGAILCVGRKIRCGSENADDPEQHEHERKSDQDAEQDSDFGLPPHLLLVRRELEEVPSRDALLGDELLSHVVTRVFRAEQRYFTIVPVSAELLSRRGLERPREILVAWARNG
jgi:hypothetical protein